jgi:hypothetical protein
LRRVGTTAGCLAAAALAAGAAPAAHGQIVAAPSPGGERAYFTTGESLLGLDADSSVDLYQRSDMLELSSQGPEGFNGAFDVSPDFLGLDDGAAFFETAEPLVAIDTDSAVDIYRRRGGTTDHFSQGGSFNGPYDAELLGATEEGQVLLATRDRLSSRDLDDAIDIYRRSEFATTFLSRGANSFNGPFDAEPQGFEPSSGFRVAFITAEQALSEDADTAADVYLRIGRTTQLISQGPQGANGPFDAIGPVTMDREASVLFFRTAEQLVGEDTDASVDLYQRTIGPLGETTLVSRGPNGFNGAFDSSAATPSNDGARALFETAEALVAADTDSRTDVYARSGGRTTLVSRGPGGFNGGFDAALREVSADGSRAFFTTAEQLVAADTDTEPDVY